MIRITKGGHGLTGAWVHSWFVWQGGHEKRFGFIKDAKEYAVSLGASGEWVRTLEPIGPRGLKCAVYRDAAEGTVVK